jgi:PAS domain S-box-containing protein
MARLLVVEDDGVVAWHLQETLEKLGHTVVATISSGALAVETADRLRPDVVLMDIRLKGPLDGVEAAEQIYSHFDIPIIYLTAHTDETTLKRAKQSAPFGYLVKPLREQDLQTTIEITLHRHQLEQRSRRVQQWFTTTLTSIADGTIATDLDGKVTFINPAAERLTGWQRQEALGQPVTQVMDLIQEDTQERIENPILLAIQQGMGVKLPDASLLRSPDGTQRPIGDTASPIRDQEGTIIGGVVVFQDLTERRQLEADMQRSHSSLMAQLQTQTAQLQQSQNHLMLGIACSQILQRVVEQIATTIDQTQLFQTTLQELGRSLDADYCWIALYNQDAMTATVTCEYTRDGVASYGLVNTTTDLRSCPQFYLTLSQHGHWIAPHPNELPHAYQPLVAQDNELLVCSISDNEMSIGEIGIVMSESMRWTSLQAELIAQMISQVAIAPRQLRSSQANQTTQELAWLNHLKEDFLDSISHELRTPLTNMRMAVEMLRRIVASLKTPNAQPAAQQNQSLLWERMERYLQVLQDEWQQEFDLISDLLNFQETEIADTPLMVVPIDLQQFLTMIVNRFTLQAERRQQRLTYQINPSLPTIYSHAPSLERILNELLSNACKYTPSFHDITVSAQTEERQVMLTVNNTGVEIPADDIERIFQPLYRSSRRQDNHQRGIGLGLALAQKLVTRLSGKITAKSSDNMTTFVVTLPLNH